MPDRRRAALAIQAGYYIASGALPLVSRKAFESLTGRKHDWWLVQMVALLAVSTGISLAVGLQDGREPSRETVTLATLSACSFTAIDVAYAANGTISPIYLVDAVVETALLAAIATLR